MVGQKKSGGDLCVCMFVCGGRGEGDRGGDPEEHI